MVASYDVVDSSFRNKGYILANSVVEDKGNKDGHPKTSLRGPVAHHIQSF